MGIFTTDESGLVIGTEDACVRYLLVDHLGSLTVTLNGTYAEVDRYAYDAWGQPVNPNNWATPLGDWGDSDPYTGDRGFTGHDGARQRGEGV